jgi:hypothetical protein
MRSTKLNAAITAAAALLLLAPAGAVARGHHPEINHKQGHPGEGCRVKLNVAPHVLTAGETVLAYGQLTCRLATAEQGQTVTLYEHAVGAIGGYTAVGTTTTDEHGFYQLSPAPIASNSTFYVTAGAARSGSRLARVAAQVTLSGPTESSQILTALRTGRRNSVTFTGTVNPADDGAIVVLQRQNAITGNDWHRIQVGVVNPGGTFTIKHVFVVPGDANIRVLVRGSSLNARGISETLSYEISQAQNPSLTILNSADPIAYGASVTISGTIAAPAGTTLTLMGHPRLHPAFVPIATTTAGSGGAYTFVTQVPLVSMQYKVIGAGKSSARMFESVKYGLTASVSSTSVPSGQAVTFSGTVTPAHAGHPVYLETQDQFGIGWHIVQVGTVSAGGTYSIVRVLYNVNTNPHKFRIKVPPDPENAGVVGSPFAITVTPAPAANLKPEPPANTTLPHEGQT